MVGVRKKRGSEYPRDLSDYICLRQPLTQVSGSTSKLVHRIPHDFDNVPLQRKMLREWAGIFPMEENKAFCFHCGEWRYRDQFGENKKRANGLRHWCKQCEAIEQRRRYWQDRDSEEMWRQWEVRHVERLKRAA